MADVLSDAYYSAPGAAHDFTLTYDEWAPDDGYLVTNVNPFDAQAEIVSWGGSSDPYTSPMLSTSDILRSRDAGVPYPASPINTTPPVVSSDTERGSFSNMFKGVVDVFGKSAVVLAGTLGAKAIEGAFSERSVPGRPSSYSTLSAGPQVIPARPIPLPSWLGGGTFTPTSSNLMYLVMGGIGLVLLVSLFTRR